MSCFSRTGERVSAATAFPLIADQRTCEFILKFKSHERKSWPRVVFTYIQENHLKGAMGLQLWGSIWRVLPDNPQWSDGVFHESDIAWFMRVTVPGATEEPLKKTQKCPQGQRVSFELFSLVEKREKVHEKRAWNYFETVSVQVKSISISSFAFPFSKAPTTEEVGGEKKTRTPPHTHTHTLQRLAFTVDGRKANIKSTSESWSSSGTRRPNS